MTGFHEVDDEPAVVVDVAGGAHGLEVQHAQARRLADRFDRAGDQLLGWGELPSRASVHGDLLQSALLAPHTFAAAEAAVGLTAVGPDGLLRAAAGWELDAEAIRLWLRGIEAAEVAVEGFWEVTDYLLGRAIGTALAMFLIQYGAPLWLGWKAAPDRLKAWLLAELQEVVLDHPGAVEHLVNGSGGLIDGLLTPLPPGAKWMLGIPQITPTAAGAATVLAGLYGPEPGTTVQQVPLPGTGKKGEGSEQPRPPRDLGDLVHQLDLVPEGGTIRVMSQTGADGVTRHILYLPGTEAWTLPGQPHGGTIRDLLTNLRLGSDADHALAAAIRQALKDQGVEPGDPVLVVGHSQGGIEAVHLATHAEDLSVGHVVTVGSAEQMADLPEDVHALHLQQHGDVVPQLDGEAPPESPHHTTVTVDNPHPGGLIGAHGINNYSDIASELPGTHPDVDRALEAHQQFLGWQGEVTTTDHQIIRVD